MTILVFVAGFIFVISYTAGSDVKPALLVANSDGLSVREAGTWQKIVLNSRHIPGSVHIRVDYDWDTGYVYWQGGTRNNYTISRINVNNLQTEILFSLPIRRKPVSFAIDWVHKLIYWIEYVIITSGENINCYHKLHVAQSDGSKAKVLHSWSILANDYGRLILDPFKKYVYFTTRNGIEKIRMDGADHQVIDDTYVNSISLDFSSDRLYFMCDSGLTSIFTNGTGKRTNLTPYYLLTPLVVYKGNIFLGVYEFQEYKLNDNKYIMRYNIQGGGLTKVSDTAEMTDFKVYEASDQKQGDNPCGKENGGCQKLCLPQSSSAYTCECPDRWFKHSNNKCYRL